MKPIFDKPIPLPRLTLVGAGPGDADLITVKGLKALQSADVVLYDALVAPELLDECKPIAEKIYVGKRAGNHEFTQDQINDIIVEKAFERGHVVRLKGGDPFVFGRGYEEIAFAKRFGIGTAYIPGISSVQGATGYENIPLTARGVSDSFWVLTGTKTDGSLTEDLQKAVQTSATVVILMGMNKLAQIAQIYAENGAGEIPAAIIQNGTRPDARIGTGTAKDLVAIAQKNQLKNPAVIVLGEVVKLRDFERKPVFEQMFIG